MKKRWTAALLTFVLAAALLLGPARAAYEPGAAGSRLTGADRAVYDILRTEILRVAAGGRTDTAIAIPDLDSLSWTEEELGVAGTGRTNVLDKLEERLYQTLHMDRVYDCLSLDLPYELCWKANQYSLSYTLSRQEGRAYVRDLVIFLYVSPAYQGGSNTTVSSAKLDAARQAAANARAIVDRHRGQSDYEKLAAYLQEICRLTAYDWSATGGRVSYGDPWQMVYVFDDDPATDVVCEGYAKALKYLCDQTDFDGDVVCYTISGTMNGGRHMWNVVQMGDGKNYLIDPTNCDDGMSGAPDTLFLIGGPSSDGGRTYTFAREGHRWSYSYHQEDEGLFADGWLPLSDSDYDPADHVSPPVRPTLSFTDVEPGAFYAEPVAWAVEEGITKGTSDTTFSPGDDCTQAQILTFLWRALGEPASGATAFSTVPDYGSALNWAAENGLVDQRLVHTSGCTRADAVRFIWMAQGRPAAPDGTTGFTDVNNSDPIAEAVRWAVASGVTRGTGPDTFSPDEVCTRGEIVTFLYRAYQQ